MKEPERLDKEYSFKDEQIILKNRECNIPESLEEETL